MIRTFEEFKEWIFSNVEKCPKSWRKGQAVFNVLDELGVAREVQFVEGVDCFYNDNNIDDFIAHSWCKYFDYIQRIEQAEKEQKDASI